VGTSHKSTVLTLIDSFARTARHAGLPRNRRWLATARSKRFSVAVLARKALIARKVMVPAVVAVRLPIVPNAATETNRAGSRRTVVVRLAAVKLRAAGADAGDIDPTTVLVVVALRETPLFGCFLYVRPEPLVN
jgi:hypothetical protein